jgi:hypothetical protein
MQYSIQQLRQIYDKTSHEKDYIFVGIDFIDAKDLPALEYLVDQDNYLDYLDALQYDESSKPMTEEKMNRIIL